MNINQTLAIVFFKTKGHYNSSVFFYRLIAIVGILISGCNNESKFQASLQSQNFFDTMFTKKLDIKNAFLKNDKYLNAQGFELLDIKFSHGKLLSLTKDNPSTNRADMSDFAVSVINVQNSTIEFFKHNNEIVNNTDEWIYAEVDWDIKSDSLFYYNRSKGELRLFKLNEQTIVKSLNQIHVPKFCTYMSYNEGSLYLNQSVYGNYIINLKDSSKRFSKDVNNQTTDYRFASISLPYSSETNLLTVLNNSRDSVLCYSVNSELIENWKISLPLSNISKRYFKILKKNNVFLIFLSDQIYCIDALNGIVNWKYNIVGDLENTLVVSNNIIFKSVDQDVFKVGVISITTGKSKWRNEFQNPINYNLPVLVSRGNIIVFDKNNISLRDMETGKLVSVYRYNKPLKDYYCNVFIDEKTGKNYFINNNSVFFD